MDPFKGKNLDTGFVVLSQRKGQKDIQKLLLDSPILDLVSGTDDKTECRGSYTLLNSESPGGPIENLKDVYLFVTMTIVDERRHRRFRIERDDCSSLYYARQIPTNECR